MHSLYWIVISIILIPIVNMLIATLISVNMLNGSDDSDTESNIMPDSSTTRFYLRNDRNKYQFNCRNIKFIKLKNVVNFETLKRVYVGEIDGQIVSVKIRRENENSTYRKNCLSKQWYLTHPQRCYFDEITYFVREILFSEQLNYPRLVQMLGYCVKDTHFDEDRKSITESMTAVYEYGEEINLDKLFSDSFETRLKAALDIAGILEYLANSPLGSLRIENFNAKTFKRYNSSIKLVEIGSLKEGDIYCKSAKDCNLEHKRLNISCEHNVCTGYNEKNNMVHANNVYFRHLLDFSVYPVHLQRDVRCLSLQLNRITISASELHNQLNAMIVTENVKKKKKLP